jgi:hypothetical protein
MPLPRIAQPVFAPETIQAYHGCSQEAADIIGETNLWIPSQKAFDWLGEGVYFWEYAPFRAWEWAEAHCKQRGGKPTVIEATIHLGRCLNLLDIEHHDGLPQAYRIVKQRYEEEQRSLPRNTSTGAHFLDQEVVNLYCRLVEQVTSTPYQTVRGCFPEGNPLYEGSKLLARTHVQIAVRDPSCIVKVGIWERETR